MIDTYSRGGGVPCIITNRFSSPLITPNAKPEGATKKDKSGASTSMSSPSSSRPAATTSTLKTSPRKRSYRALPKVTTSPSKRNLALPTEDGVDDDEEDEDGLTKGAFAGPSSPSRRRRRPSASRRRSSSITAAAGLMSAYSSSSTSPRMGGSDGKRPSAGGQQDHEDDDDYEDEDREADARPGLSKKASDRSDATFGGGATETFQDARTALGRGKPSPYHMAVVTLFGALAQGMPLASMFKAYTYMMCRVYDDRGHGHSLDDSEDASKMMRTMMMLPPAPELPSSPSCNDPWVQKATSNYAATMATVGALLGLVLLDRCTRISRRFGRKPLMLFTHALLALAFVAFRLSVSLPTYVGAALLYLSVVIFEASAGAPLRIAVQNYVVDVTTETQRAGALSFIDGFGQMGAFPSSTLGGWLAASTQKFFAPFYAAVAIYAAAIAYILVLVPESKRNRHHTLIDDFEHFGEGDGQNQDRDNEEEEGSSSGKDDGATANGGTGLDREEQQRRTAQRRISYVSTAPSESMSFGSTDRPSRFRRLLYRLNFLAPLSIFWPRRKNQKQSRSRNASHDANAGSGGEDCEDTKKGPMDYRLLNLAMIVVFEESFQVFLVPVLILYNTEVFKYDVVQNGYLVSLLQGVRALYLTAVFPPAVAKAREWIKASVKRRAAKKDAQWQRQMSKSPQQQQQQNGGEREPLLAEQRNALGISGLEGQAGRRPPPSPGQGVATRDMAQESSEGPASRNDDSEDAPTQQQRRTQEVSTDAIEAKRDQRGKLDVAILLVSYLLSAASFILLARTRAAQDPDAKAVTTAKTAAPWVGLALGIVGLQLGAGATSVRTALIVNAVSHPDDDDDDDRAREDAEEGSETQAAHSSSSLQSKALAANQILCTAVYAIVPLLTSAVYGWGLQRGQPQVVWYFKAIFAGLSALGSGVLLLHHKNHPSKEEESTSSDSSSSST